MEDTFSARQALNKQGCWSTNTSLSWQTKNLQVRQMLKPATPLLHGAFLGIWAKWTHPCHQEYLATNTRVPCLPAAGDFALAFASPFREPLIREAENQLQPWWWSGWPKGQREECLSQGTVGEVGQATAVSCCTGATHQLRLCACLEHRAAEEVYAASSHLAYCAGFSSTSNVKRHNAAYIEAHFNMRGYVHFLDSLLPIFFNISFPVQPLWFSQVCRHDCPQCCVLLGYFLRKSVPWADS